MYCKPVPQIANGFATSATNVTYGGAAKYECYNGFNFASGKSEEEIYCTDEGRWTPTPMCKGARTNSQHKRVLSENVPGARSVRRRLQDVVVRRRHGLRHRLLVRVRARLPSTGRTGAPLPQQRTMEQPAADLPTCALAHSSSLQVCRASKRRPSRTGWWRTSRTCTTSRRAPR